LYFFAIKSNIGSSFYNQLCSIFGKIHHTPYEEFLMASKTHNNGKKLEFIKPSDCRMGDKAVQLLRVLRLKNALTECVASKAFRDMKQFAILREVLLHEGSGTYCGMYAKYCIQCIVSEDWLI
jgi:hypothetical protein